MKPQSQPAATPSQAIAPARAAAFHILSRVAVSAAHSDDLLHSLAVNALSPEDRNLTTTLVLGVLRWQIHLDAVLLPMMQRPDADLHHSALLALRMGLFQLLFLDRVPAHAALNESVELARANGAAHAAGMVNAILRRASREKPGTRKPLVAATTPAEQAHPDWLLLRWQKHLGRAAARLAAEYDQAEPPAHALFEPGPELPEIDDGSRLVAEIAAAAAPLAERVLDCCAAPGGKTAVLAARLPKAEIIAADISEKRLSAMRKRLDRSPATARVTTVLADMTGQLDAPLSSAGFDLILCDAPCSGTGTLARNPEIRHRLRPSDLPRQAERQRGILTAALRLLLPGGRLVYSTCSLEPEENEAVVNEVLAKTRQVRLLPPGELLEGLGSLKAGARERLAAAVGADGAIRILPGTMPCDGFYVAVLQRDA